MKGITEHYCGWSLPESFFYKSTDKFKKKYSKPALTLNQAQIVGVILENNGVILLLHLISVLFWCFKTSFTCIIRPLFYLYAQFNIPKKKMK